MICIIFVWGPAMDLFSFFVKRSLIIWPKTAPLHNVIVSDILRRNWAVYYSARMKSRSVEEAIRES